MTLAESVVSIYGKNPLLILQALEYSIEVAVDSSETNTKIVFSDGSEINIVISEMSVNNP